MSAVSSSPGSVLACNLAGHWLCMLDWFKCRGVGLPKQQNLPHPAPCLHHVVSVRRAPQEHTLPAVLPWPKTPSLPFSSGQLLP